MAKLTDGQIRRLNFHLAEGATAHGVLIGDLGARTRRGELVKSQQIALIRRSLVAEWRQTVRFTRDKLFIHPELAPDDSEPISYPRVGHMLFYANHTSALLAHRQWKRENETDLNVTGDIAPDEVERGKAAVRGKDELAGNA